MKLLYLDPAASTGYCYVEISGDTATILDYGFIEVPSQDFLGDQCLDLYDKVRMLLQRHPHGQIDEVGVEDYFFGKRFASGCNVNTSYRAAIFMACRNHQVPYDILNITEWKKHIAGRATPTKEHKRKWGKEPAKKLYIQEALWHKYGIRFTNHSISLKTGKPIQFRYDIVDVVAQAIFHCEIKYQVKHIKTDVIPEQDIVWKKQPKTMFFYD